MKARNENIIVIEEKGDGDSATISDVKIGELFSKRSPELLSDSLKPVLSLVYLPEYEFNGEKGLLFEAIDTEEGAKVNDRKILATDKEELSELLCINHIHRDTELNEIEDKISSKCGKREKRWNRYIPIRFK